MSRAARPVGFVPTGRRIGELETGRDIGVVAIDSRLSSRRAQGCRMGVDLGRGRGLGLMGLGDEG